MTCEFRTTTVRNLVDAGLIERPMDGNHGELHPKVSDFVAAGIPFIMASDLVDGRVDIEHCVFIRAKQAARLRKGFARTDDVLLSHKATMGRTALVGELATPYIMLTPQVTYYRVLERDQLEPRYLKYYFDSPDFQELFAAWGNGGSTRSYLGITAQLQLPIVLPSIECQRDIAYVLGTLDDKIALNRRTNRTLELTARAIFRSWFVDFDPVVAKSEGRRALGVSDVAHAAMPDRFTETNDGPVPHGWALRPIIEFIEVNPTRRLRTGVVAPYLDMANVPTVGHAPQHWALRATGSGQRFVNGDTLLARITPCLENGKTAYVDFLAADEVGWGSTEFIVLHPRAPIPPVFAYCLARWPDFREHAERSMTGSSGRQRVALDALEAYRFVCPPDRVARAFGDVVEPLFAKARANMLEIRSLAALRNALLPQLLSGAMRLRDAENVIATAV